MESNLGKYQEQKIKKNFKKKKFLLFFNSARLNSKNWINIDQTFRKQKLSYLKILNSAALKIINKSIYKNFNKTVSSIFTIVKPNYNSTLLNFKTIITNLNPLFVLFMVKLNKNVYSPQQVTNIKTLSYTGNTIKLLNTLDLTLKCTYKITQKSRNNVT